MNISNLVKFPITFDGESQPINDWETLLQRYFTDINSISIQQIHKTRRKIAPKEYSEFVTFLMGTEYELFLYNELLSDYYKHLKSLQIHPNYMDVSVGQVNFYRDCGIDLKLTQYATNPTKDKTGKYDKYLYDFAYLKTV